MWQTISICINISMWQSMPAPDTCSECPPGTKLWCPPAFVTPRSGFETRFRCKTKRIRSTRGGKVWNKSCWKWFKWLIFSYFSPSDEFILLVLQKRKRVPRAFVWHMLRYDTRVAIGGQHGLSDCHMAICSYSFDIPIISKMVKAKRSINQENGRIINQLTQSHHFVELLSIFKWRNILQLF